MGLLIFLAALAAVTVWALLHYGPKDMRTGRSLFLPAPRETRRDGRPLDPVEQAQWRQLVAEFQREET